MASSTPRITVAEIARQLQLGTSTVAHVLNGRGDELRIGAQTQQRVWQMARELGYRPNSSARAMRLGRFGSVALIQPSNDIFLPAAMLLGLIRDLQKQGMHLSISEAPDSALSDSGFLPKVIREQAADGLLINMASEMPPAFLETVEAQGTPVVWINSKHPYDAVYPDDLHAAQELTCHLLGMGHRRILYVASRPEGQGQHYSETDRRKGYAAAMKAAGCKAVFAALETKPGQSEPPGDARQANAREILKELRPTAVIAYEVPVALPIYHAALSLGWQVPQQLSIAMFHSDIEYTSGVGFTTMYNLAWDWGTAAAQMLIERINEPQKRLKARPLPSRLDPGRTCAPPL